MTTWDPDGEGPAGEVLVVGGLFGMAAETPASCIAAWDGTSWSALGSGMNEGVLSLCVFEGDLVAAGRFTEAGGTPAEHIARWDGTGWSALGAGLNGVVYATTVYNGELYAGGTFTVNGQRSIARWDGAAWQGVGGGMSLADCAHCGTSVGALAIYNGELIAGGYFTRAGSTSAKYIARWNGSTWGSLGFGTNNQVAALAVYNGQLIVGGHFTEVGSGLSALRIVRWDPGQPSAWGALGGGITGAGANVAALAVHQGVLFAGGFFQSTADGPASNIARWDGTAWSPVGDGLGSTVHALTVYAGDLVAGGHFTSAGAIASSHWAVWRDLPEPQFDQQPTHQFLQYGQQANFPAVVSGGQGTLQYAWRRGGELLSDGGQYAGTGTPQLTISAVTPENQGLYDLLVTDDCGQVSSDKVTLGVLCPGVYTLPAAQSLIVGQDANFEVSADAPGTLQFQWRRNNVPLVDDEQISGAQTASLTISRANKHNAGSYDVMITADCGQRITPKVNLVVTCPAFVRADFDVDCDVDGADLAILQTCAAGADVPARPECPNRLGNQIPDPVADLDDDGDVDMNDFGRWQRCFSGPAVPPMADCLE